MTTFTAPRMLALAGTLATTFACASGGAASTDRSAAPAEAGAVGSDVIQRNPTDNLEEILRGRVAGVIVTRASDGGLAVRIRGASSFSADETPLYVLDGVITQPGPSGSLGLNPYDIESIKVLKDPASLTMYGSRGANGVIVITTKRPGAPR